VAPKIHNVKQFPQDMVIVLLYDPKPLEDVSIDAIRNQTSFDVISYIAEQGVIPFKSTKTAVQGSFQTTRLEFIDKNRTPFEHRDTKVFKNLLNSLPRLSVKAIGINLFLNIKLEESRNAGQYIRDNFLKNGSTFEEKLGSPIFANSIRLFYGKMDNHFDLRLTPLQLEGDELNMQLHYHRDIHIVDTQKLISTARNFLKEEKQELKKLVKILF